MFQVARDANKIDIKRAVEPLLGSKVAERAHVAGARQDEAPGQVRRPALGLEEGVREAAGRREAARVPAGSVRHHAYSQIQPDIARRRGKTSLTFDEITTNEPHRPLTENLHRSGGRNNQGELTSWWRGGGHKRLYRIIDFKRDKKDIPAKVATVEYDPNRSARIALRHLCRRREALHPAAGGHEGRRHDRGRRQRRHPAGQLPAAEEHSARHA